MTTPLKVVQFPDRDLQDVPKTLRILADRIEQGTYDAARNLAWVIDCGNGRVEAGLIGAAAEPGAEAHLLFALAQRKLEEL